MILKNYFEKTGIQKSWFAKKIGMKPSYLYQICSGAVPIPRKYWKKIVDLTEGKISLEELLEDSIETKTENVDSMSSSKE